MARFAAATKVGNKKARPAHIPCAGLACRYCPVDSPGKHSSRDDDESQGGYSPTKDERIAEAAQFVNPYSQNLTFVQYTAAIHLWLPGKGDTGSCRRNLCLLTDRALRVWHAAQYEFCTVALVLPPPGWAVRRKFPPLTRACHTFNTRRLPWIAFM